MKESAKGRFFENKKGKVWVAMGGEEQNPVNGRHWTS